MNKSDIDRVRGDIKDYEHHKKVKHLSTAGIASGIGAAGVGSYNLYDAPSNIKIKRIKKNVTDIVKDEAKESPKKTSFLKGFFTKAEKVKENPLKSRSFNLPKLEAGHYKKIKTLLRPDKLNRPMAALTAAGLLTAAGSGYLKGRAKRKEHHALNRIKHFYDLRKIPHSEDNHEKTATSGLLEMALQLGHHYADIIPTITDTVASHSHWLGSATPLAVPATMAATDVVLAPLLGELASGSTLNSGYVGAKNMLGKHPLSSSELKTQALTSLSRSARQSAEKIKTPVVGGVARYLSGLGATWEKGGRYGEVAGKALKEVDRFSPRYADMGLEAIKGGVAMDKLKSAVKEDVKTFQETTKRLNKTIDKVPLLRRGLNATGSSSEQLIQTIMKDPKVMLNWADRIDDTVVRSIRGGKYMLGAAALAGIGLAAGGYRNRHPLASDSLPKKIVDHNSNILEFRG